MTLAAWLALLPLRLLAALGLRRSLILVCLFVLAVTAYGVAEDLGLLDPPAAAKPARPTRPDRLTGPSAAARGDIPASYLRLYRRAAVRCPGLSWSVLAAVGKVESDHGRSRLPGVRSGWNAAGAAGPMQFGIGVGRAGNAWPATATTTTATATQVSMTPVTPSPPPPTTYVRPGRPVGWTGPCTPTTTPGRMWPRSSSSPAAISPEGVGDGDRGQLGPTAVSPVRQSLLRCGAG